MKHRFLLSLIAVFAMPTSGMMAWEEPSFEAMERFQQEHRIYQGTGEGGVTKDARVEAIARRPRLKGNFNQRLRGMLQEADAFALSQGQVSAIVALQDRYHQGDSLHHRRNWCLGGINRDSYRHAAADTKMDASRYYANTRRWIDLLTKFELDDAINQARMQCEVWSLFNADQKRLFLESGGLLDGVLGNVSSGHSKAFRMHNVLKKAMGKQWIEHSRVNAKIGELTAVHNEYKKRFFAEKERWERVGFYAWDSDDAAIAQAFQPMATIQAEMYLLATRDLRTLYQLFTGGSSSQSQSAAIARAIEENWKAEVKKRVPLAPDFLSAIGVGD